MISNASACVITELQPVQSALLRPVLLVSHTSLPPNLRALASHSGHNDGAWSPRAARQSELATLHSCLRTAWLSRLYYRTGCLPAMSGPGAQQNTAQCIRATHLYNIRPSCTVPVMALIPTRNTIATKGKH